MSKGDVRREWPDESDGIHAREMWANITMDPRARMDHERNMDPETRRAHENMIEHVRGVMREKGIRTVEQLERWLKRDRRECALALGASPTYSTKSRSRASSELASYLCKHPDLKGQLSKAQKERIIELMMGGGIASMAVGRVRALDTRIYI